MPVALPVPHSLSPAALALDGADMVCKCAVFPPEKSKELCYILLIVEWGKFAA